MIDRAHDLPITKQAAALNIKPALHLLPALSSAVQSTCEHSQDFELFLEFTFWAVGRWCIGDVLAGKAAQVSARQNATTLLKSDGDSRRSLSPVLAVPRIMILAIRSVHICCAV